MAVTFDGSELNQLAADIQNSAGAVGAKASAAIRKTAHNIEQTAKVFAPVDTGNLMGSISTTIEGDGRFTSIAAEIGPTADYGHHVEFGTSQHAPAAYMGPAFDRHGYQLEAALLQVAAQEIA